MDLRERIATVLGKGRRPRIVTFGSRTALAIDRYLRERRLHRDAERPELWLGHPGAGDERWDRQRSRSALREGRPVADRGARLPAPVRPRDAQLGHAGDGLGATGRAEPPDGCARKLAIGPATITAYNRLIADRPDHEPSFHEFLARYPRLLDPAAVEVWSKPDLSGAREPYFVLRRIDDSYVVIEIETPAKPIMTNANQMSSQATQAVAQATTYRSFLMERFPLAASHFPRFHEPDCLVVIGLEQTLTPDGVEALARGNLSRNRPRIVGYDWLANRAAAIV